MESGVSIATSRRSKTRRYFEQAVRQCPPSSAIGHPSTRGRSPPLVALTPSPARVAMRPSPRRTPGTAAFQPPTCVRPTGPGQLESRPSDNKAPHREDTNIHSRALAATGVTSKLVVKHSATRTSSPRAAPRPALRSSPSPSGDRARHPSARTRRTDATSRPRI